MRKKTYPVLGAGIGLRRDLLDELEAVQTPQINFMELAPENWIRLGGRQGKRLRGFTERYPIVAHGLSLSLGGPDPLDEVFLLSVKDFLEMHHIRCYSEHLSYCSDGGHFYDLMPIPFTDEAITHVAQRIQRTQEILERRIAIENVSYYAAPGKEMDEIQFINAILTEADCDLLLDVNNSYVNSINHGYDAEAFLQSLPGERIAYCHIAGHHQEDVDLIIDTHGADVINPVWKLLDAAYGHFGVIPTLLERDFNIPPLAELLQEVECIHAIQNQGFHSKGTLLSHG